MKEIKAKSKAQKRSKKLGTSKFRLVLSSVSMVRAILCQIKGREFKSAHWRDTRITYMMKNQVDRREPRSLIFTTKSREGLERLAILSPGSSPKLNYLSFGNLKPKRQILGTFLSKEHILNFYEDKTDSKVYWSLNKVSDSNPSEFMSIQPKQPYASQGTDSWFHIESLPINDYGDRLLSMGRGAIQLYRFKKDEDKIESFGEAGSLEISKKGGELKSSIFVRTEEGVYVVAASGYKWSEEDTNSGYHLALYKLNFKTSADFTSANTNGAVV